MCELSDAAADPGRAGVQGAEPLGSPVFEHRAAVPTPHGGGTIDHSLIRPAQLAPCHDIRYSRCLLRADWCVKSETHLVVCTCLSGRLASV